MKRSRSVSTTTALDPHLIPTHNAAMSTKTLDPLISEFETQEQADSYDAWFRAKVQESMDSKKPRIPHDQVMAEMWEIIHNSLQKKVA